MGICNIRIGDANIFKNDKIKTGDNLYKAIPSMFEGNEVLETEQLFEEIELIVL